MRVPFLGWFKLAESSFVFKLTVNEKEVTLTSSANPSSLLLKATINGKDVVFQVRFFPFTKIIN